LTSRCVDLGELNVGISYDERSVYPVDAPFSPREFLPEYPFTHYSEHPNSVYRQVREALHLLGCDDESYDTPLWNPMSGLIRPGNRVLLKPNMVTHRHPRGGDLFAVVTHPAVIRAMVDYAFIALQGDGQIVIADAPQIDCDFDLLREHLQLSAIQDLYWREKGFRVQVLDLRPCATVQGKWRALPSKRKRIQLPGDPLGSARVNLGVQSLLYGLPGEKRLYGADYNRVETMAHHTGKVHEYDLAKTVLAADVVVSLPKMKVHKKVGVSLNLKGLVGVCTNKNLLVHYRLGSPSNGGDQYPNGVLESRELAAIRIKRWAYDRLLAKRGPLTDLVFAVGVRLGQLVLRPLGLRVRGPHAAVDGGNWVGNDSTWRMVLDLYRATVFSDSEGKLQTTPMRRFFSVVDGIVGGEGEGPITPTRRHCGVIAAGSHLGAVDAVCAALMGLDISQVKVLTYLSDHASDLKLDVDCLSVYSNHEGFSGGIHDVIKNTGFRFSSPTGWPDLTRTG